MAMVRRRADRVEAGGKDEERGGKRARGGEGRGEGTSREVGGRVGGSVDGKASTLFTIFWIDLDSHQNPDFFQNLSFFSFFRKSHYSSEGTHPCAPRHLLGSACHIPNPYIL